MPSRCQQAILKNSSPIRRILIHKKGANHGTFQCADKPSHSVSVLRAGAHECSIRSAPVLVLPRLQRFSVTLSREEDKGLK
ncbi:hypothetical protein [Bacillus sp. WP8]|uniref:hypothetical protein n=1 Tax=Bacillus sp. WP8 TaxID=756828 RepID=UPI0021B3E28A|nr:hypothetical protein [Bacillus sp. WP8]